MSENSGTSGTGAILGRAKRARLLARQFTGEGKDLSKVHVAEGVLAASDGRILLHVEDGDIHREEGDGDAKGVLGFSYDIESAVKVGGAEWCRGALREEAFRLTQEACMEAAAARRGFRREVEDARRQCPCCGEAVYEWGERLLTEEEMEAEECDCRALDRHKTIAVVTADGVRMVFNAVYLNMAMTADLEFGGLEGMWLSTGERREAAFRGNGWFVVIMPIREDGYGHCETNATVKADGAGVRGVSGLPAVIWRMGWEVGGMEAGWGGTATARQDGDNGGRP